MEQKEMFRACFMGAYQQTLSNSTSGKSVLDSTKPQGSQIPVWTVLHAPWSQRKLGNATNRAKGCSRGQEVQPLWLRQHPIWAVTSSYVSGLFLKTFRIGLPLTSLTTSTSGYYLLWEDDQGVFVQLGEEMTKGRNSGCLLTILGVGIYRR